MAKWTPRPTRFGGMYLMGRWADFGKGRGQQWIPYPFRAPGSGKHKAWSYSRPQVRGGRWKVRRFPVSHSPDGKPWRAWSDGKAKRWNRRFATHDEAVKWAELVAITYRNHDDIEANAILGLHLRYNWEGQDNEPGIYSP